jgi:hypothetical protein
MILSQLPRRISATGLTNTGRDRIVSDIESALDEAGTGLDLDAATDAGLDLAPRPLALYDFDDLDRVSHRKRRELWASTSTGF